MAWAWTGVGITWLRASRARRIGSAKPSSENLLLVTRLLLSAVCKIFEASHTPLGTGCFRVPGAAGTRCFCLFVPGKNAAYESAFRAIARQLTPGVWASTEPKSIKYLYFSTLLQPNTEGSIAAISSLSPHSRDFPASDAMTDKKFDIHKVAAVFKIERTPVSRDAMMG